MDMLKDLMKKKGKGEGMDPKEKDAKMSVLKDIRDMAANDMGDEVKSLKKVSVMAPDQHGLEEGLHKAQEMVGGDHPESPFEEAAEPSVSGAKVAEDLLEHEGDESELSPEEIDALIAELQEQKAKKLAAK